MLDRYHTTSVGPDEEALRAAFLKCGELMKVHGCAVVGLAVHTKNNLDGAIRSVFGEGVVRVLDRDNKLELKGIVIHLLTEKIQLRRLEGPVLAAFLNPKKIGQDCCLQRDDGHRVGALGGGRACRLPEDPS